VTALEQADPVDKAAVLAEALPYIRDFRGATFVIKYGGAAMDDPSLQESFASDIVLLHHVGLRPVVVHGGGPQISSLMKRLGKEPEFVDGQRVTDAETALIARMVLVGQVNRDIVGMINRHGPLAAGLSGEDACLLEVTPRDARLGYVGDVSTVNPDIVLKLLDDGFIPVIATVARGDDGHTYNINADTVAGEIALALGAEKLVFLTDVEGLYRDLSDAGSVISQITAVRLRGILAGGSLSSGMIPKITACVRAVEGGVRTAHILDGRVRHALLLEVFTKEGIGTMVVHEPD
jgi:acetylglutamate kinase